MMSLLCTDCRTKEETDLDVRVLEGISEDDTASTRVSPAPVGNHSWCSSPSNAALSNTKHQLLVPEERATEVKGHTPKLRCHGDDEQLR